MSETRKIAAILVADVVGLRAGFATSAAQAGASTIKIRAQTGHSSDAMLSRYVRDGELFVGNVAGALL